MLNEEEWARYQYWRNSGRTHQQYINTYDVDEETADELWDRYHRFHPPLPPLPPHTTIIIRR